MLWVCFLQLIVIWNLCYCCPGWCHRPHPQAHSWFHQARMWLWIRPHGRFCSRVWDTPNQPHHDLIHEIRQKIAGSPIVWTYRHVRGHQDKHVSYHFLNPWSQLNAEMDGLAKAYWNDTHADVAPFYPKHSFGWSLWINGRRLSTWDRTALYNHANSIEILAHTGVDAGRFQQISS
jgi:hypothetical protein